MAGETPDLEMLLGEWRKLAPGDRKAILRRMPADRRLEFRRLLARPEVGMAGASAPARRYRVCSAWLAALLEACETGAPDAAGLRPPVRAALLEGHEQASAMIRNDASPSLLDLALAFLRRLGDRR